MISVQEYKPSSLLESFVECYTHGIFNIHNDPGASFPVVPGGCLELIIHLEDQHCKIQVNEDWTHSPDYMLIGLFTRVHTVRFSHRVPVFSIRFKPEALFTLFRIEGTEVLGQYEDITSLLGKTFRDFCHRIHEDQTVNAMISRTEEFLISKIQINHENGDYVMRAAEIMRRSDISSIKEISDAVSISQRQLERKFRNVIGVSPKSYLRLLRINRVIRLIELNRPMDLTSVAYHCGYFDQAHFINDFKLITGHKPTLYTKGSKQFIVHPGYFPMEE